jgi:hypothetical protein
MMRAKEPAGELRPRLKPWILRHIQHVSAKLAEDENQEWGAGFTQELQ